jgi:hypothetical protein
MLETPVALSVAPGFFAGVLIAIGVLARPAVQNRLRFEPGLAATYRLVGTVFLVATLLFVTLDDGSYASLALEARPITVVTGLGATAGVVECWLYERRGTLSTIGAVWVTVAVAGLLISAVLISLVPPLPALVVLVCIHVLVLGTLIATAGAAVDLESPALLNVTALAFLIQLLVFLGTTVFEATTSATALVLTGTILLLAGIALERGRRRLLDRMGALRE